MEAKRDVILREANESGLRDLSPFQDKLAELNSTKAHPYGTLHAVGAVYYCLQCGTY